MAKDKIKAQCAEYQGMMDVAQKHHDNGELALCRNALFTLANRYLNDEHTDAALITLLQVCYIDLCGYKRASDYDADRLSAFENAAPSASLDPQTVTRINKALKKKQYSKQDMLRHYNGAIKNLTLPVSLFTDAEAYELIELYIYGETSEADKTMRAREKSFVKAQQLIYANPNEAPPISEKKRKTALVLCFLGFIGLAGLHRFYTGKLLSGFVFLITLGGFFVGSFIDMQRISAGSFRDSKGSLIIR